MNSKAAIFFLCVVCQCLVVWAFYLVWENANQERRYADLEMQNRLLSGDNAILQSELLKKSMDRTYQDGVTDAMVRLSDPNSSRFQAEAYVDGYHAAVHDAQRSKLAMVVEPEKPQPVRVAAPPTPSSTKD